MIFTYVLGAMTEPMATEGISPQKKRGPPEEEKLSLEAIREVVRGEVGGSNAALKAELSHRMDRVESGVTNQLEKSLEKLAAITGQQQEQQRWIETIQGEHTGAKGAGPAVGGGVQHSRHGPGKPQASPRPGGWGDDTPAEETLNQVRQMVKDLDTEQAVAPGVRRGYTILPYGARQGEDQQQMRERLSTALRRVRQANIQTGVHGDGKAKFLWMQLSQFSEKRRRVQLAGKCKRLCLTLGATLSQVEIESSTGTVWLKGTRICSATTAKLGGGRGWMDQP